jgi:hypothetical protein
MFQKVLDKVLVGKDSPFYQIERAGRAKFPKRHPVRTGEKTRGNFKNDF